jgi:hypothetical protein
MQLGLELILMRGNFSHEELSLFNFYSHLCSRAADDAEEGAHEKRNAMKDVQTKLERMKAAASQRKRDQQNARK